jgi:hypothetical protein
MTQDELKALVVYDAETGRFTATANRVGVEAGRELGGITAHGYVQMGLHGKIYYAHRLAWFYVHGRMPSEIDHINRNRSDNRLANLREVTRSQNNMNRLGKPSRSNHPGVWKNKSGWCAVIRVGGQRRYLGNFRTIEQASLAYQAAQMDRDACDTFSPS